MADDPELDLHGLRVAEALRRATAFLQRPVPPLQFVSAVQDLLGRSAFIRRGQEAR